MEVTVRIPTDRTEQLTIEEETYGGLLERVGLSPQEATVLVEGTPVALDQHVEAEEVTVLRLIAGG